MSAGFTPGPWRYENNESRIVTDSPLCTNFMGDPRPVLDLFGAMGGDDTNADASLIAAAPDMFESLTLCHRVMHECTAVLTANDCAKVVAAMAVARATLAKANPNHSHQGTERGLKSGSASLSPNQDGEA